MQRKSFKVAIVVLVLLVVIAGVGGVCYSFLKPSNVPEGQDAFKIVINNFELGHNSASDGYNIFLSDDVQKQIADKKYVEIIIELKDFEYEKNLTWSFYNSSSELVDSLEYATLSVSDDGLSVTVKITSLDNVEDGVFFFVVTTENVSESSFFVVWTINRAYLV